MTSDKLTALEELRERVRTATGPSRELDARIIAAVLAPATATVNRSEINGAWVIYDGVEQRSGRPRCWPTPQEFKDEARGPTSSVDGSLSLVERVLPHLSDAILHDAAQTANGRPFDAPLSQFLPPAILDWLLSALIAQGRDEMESGR